MYCLGKLTDFRESDSQVVYLTPRKRAEVWLCRPVVPVAKAVDIEGFLWGMVFEFTDLDGKTITVAINRKLINKSGVSLTKGLASWGLSVNPGYERQFAAYLSAKLESVKTKKTVARVSDACRLKT